MQRHDLSDAQWCVLDLLMRSRQKGIYRLNRREMLQATELRQEAAIKLTWAALTMPADLVTWHGQHDFSITDDGIAVFNLRFGSDSKNPEPTRVADAAICLPGPGATVN